MANSTVYPYGTNGELPSSIGIINDRKTGGVDKALSAQQGVEIGQIIDPVALVNIPFDGGNRYIAQATGAITNHANWRSTKYIPVQEGDVFYYTGTPGGVSLGVGGYLYDADYDTYTFVGNNTGRLIDRSSNYLTDKLIVIPRGITHIVAVAGTSSPSYSLKKQTESTLSKLVAGLGVVPSVDIKIRGDFTKGNYVSSSGNWVSSSAYCYIDIDVVRGDVIDLIDLRVNNTNVSVISKKNSSTSFTPLLILDEIKTYGKVTYEVPEDMTLCISLYWDTYYNPRIFLVKHNKFNGFEMTGQLLATTRHEIADKNSEENVLDMQLGHLFEKIAVIGDSMSRGTLSSSSDADVDADGGGLSSFGASWLSFLAKRWGCKGKFHYANSGTSCHTWLNNSVYGLGRMLKDTTIYNAYFIAYGHNDTASVGSASDEAAPVTITESGGNYTVSCPNGYSFCAYYKAIINQIRAKAPHAMIFCLSEYDGVMVSSKPTYRQAIINVAEAYYNGGDTLVHHLETGGVTDGGGGLTLGTHYSTVGYAYIAKRVDEEAGKCVYQHRTDTAIQYFGSYNLPKNEDGPWA